MDEIDGIAMDRGEQAEREGDAAEDAEKWVDMREQRNDHVRVEIGGADARERDREVRGWRRFDNRRREGRRRGPETDITAIAERIMVAGFAKRGEALTDADSDDAARDAHPSFAKVGASAPFAARKEAAAARSVAGGAGRAKDAANAVSRKACASITFVHVRAQRSAAAH